MVYVGMSVLKRGQDEWIVLKRQCSKCHKEIDIDSDDLKFCPYCGKELKFKPKYQCVDGVLDFLNSVNE